jgi:hypothetical protein
MELRLDQDDPTARSTTTTVKRPVQFAAEAGGSASVGRRRARTGMELAVEDLSHEMSRYRSKIAVSCAASCWISHG